jgi:hypothetical protein
VISDSAITAMRRRSTTSPTPTAPRQRVTPERTNQHSAPLIHTSRRLHSFRRCVGASPAFSSKRATRHSLVFSAARPALAATCAHIKQPSRAQPHIRFTSVWIMRPIRFESASVPKTQPFSPQPAGRHRRTHLATFLHDNAAYRRVITTAEC